VSASTVVDPERPNVVTLAALAFPLTLWAAATLGQAHNAAATIALAMTLQRTDCVCRMLTSTFKIGGGAGKTIGRMLKQGSGFFGISA